MLERARLVTLTGAPGIGKSRLALALMDEAPRGGAAAHGAPGETTRLVELAPIARPAHVPRAVASALGVDEAPGQDLTDTLVARLRQRRRTLLVLDNCEHLLNGCAKLVAALLRGGPELRILATSREPLGIADETVWRVPPLRVPESHEAVPEALAESPAVELFVARAAAVQQTFSLNAYVAPAVADICRRLDGVPLAIEVAAAGVESLTPVEVARRLDDRFALLDERGTADLSRHHTLQAALDWSHELLSEPEQTLLRRLSMFVGGFDEASAEAVCSGGNVEADEVRELLGSLVRKSLVVANATDAPGRYRLLEMIRAYAGERLHAAGEAGALRRAHARFFLALAERAEPELSGVDQEPWLARLEAERADLRAALEWSLGHGETEQALRLAGALVLFWRVRCHFGEGRELLDAAVAAGDGAPSRSMPKALWGVGFMALMLGEFDAAIPPLEESLSRFRELGDCRGCARTLLILGNCAQYRDKERGLSLLEESAALAREVGDAWCLSHALGVAGNVHLHRSELVAARPLFEQAVAVAREAQDKQGLRFGLSGLAAVVLRQGELDLAESLLEETIAITEDLGEDYNTASAVRYVGEVAIVRGEYARARELFERAAALYRDVGHYMGSIDALLGLAEAARGEGNRQAARRLFEEALASARAHGGTLIAAIQGLGELTAEDGRPEAARRLFDEALELARALGIKAETARALHGLAELARSHGERNRAIVLHDEALELRRAIGSVPQVTASLEAVAGLAAEDARYRDAARLLGAAKALRERNGYVRAPWELRRHEADLALVRHGLAPIELQAVFAAGERLSLERAVTEASVGAGPRGRPATGWPSLTEREQEVAALVAEGLTNPEIAERLFITRGTVKRHLLHIFRKLGLAERTELAREARRR